MLILQSDALQLEFDSVGLLQRFTNRLTGTVHGCRDAGFTIHTAERCYRQADFAATVERWNEHVGVVRYTGEFGVVVRTWKLALDAHFAEGQLTLIPATATALTTVTLFDFALTPAQEDTELVEYRYIDFATFDEMPNHQIWQCYRDQDTEPSRLCFGRNAAGGFFLGLEATFDISQIGGRQVTLAIRPMMKLGMNEPLETEAAFLGVYANGALDEAVCAEWRDAVDRGVFSADYFKGGILNNELVQLSSAGGASAPSPWKQPAACRPSFSESRAMTAMTSRIMGPPRFGVMALACGWHCDMSQEAFTPATLAHDLKALEIFAACGMDGFSDSHPWGGETAKMNGLCAGDSYAPDAANRQLAMRARELNLGVGQWPTFNKTHPWRPSGQPFRADRPDWRRGVIPCDNPNPNYENFRVKSGNCLGAPGFLDWLLDIYRDALDTGLYRYCLMDGDFWGTGAYSTTTVPVQCAAEDHTHLPIDSNYVSQLAAQRMVKMIRDEYPRTYIFQCRPLMDLGIWALRNSDACFTLIEAGSGEDNLLAGNAIRMSSRIRVHQHFIPHWLDSTLLFPSHYHPTIHPKWPREKMDFVLLSALASSPNLLFYLPTAHPEEFTADDQERIRFWLEWGREHEKYLMVRHDFPAWPSEEHPDGSAHLVNNTGLLFWFNSSSQVLMARFQLNAEEAGFTGKEGAQISELYPTPGEARGYATGDTVTWEIPPGSAVVLWVAANQSR